MYFRCIKNVVLEFIERSSNTIFYQYTVQQICSYVIIADSITAHTCRYITL